MAKKLSPSNQRTVESIEWKYTDELAINQWTVRDIWNDLKKVKKTFIATGLVVFFVFLISFIPMIISARSFNLKIAYIIIGFISCAFVCSLLYLTVYDTRVFSYRFTSEHLEITDWSDRYSTARRFANYILIILGLVLLVMIGIAPKIALFSIGGVTICGAAYGILFYSEHYAKTQTDYRQDRATWTDFNSARIDRSRNVVFLFYHSSNKKDKKNKTPSRLIFCGEHLNDMITMLNQQPHIQQMEGLCLESSNG